MSLDLTEDKSTLVQVMAWCRQATSHYLSQCWPRSVSYGVIRPQWVNSLALDDAIQHHRTWSILVQVMAWCYQATTHYLNQWGLIINEVLWHWSKGYFTGIAQGINNNTRFENDTIWITFAPPNELMITKQCKATFSSLTTLGGLFLRL